MIKKLISISKEQETAIKKLAEELEINATAVIRKMIDEYLMRAKYGKS